MLCDICGEREANVRVTRIEGGSARTVGLCETCAGLPAGGGVLELLAGLLGSAMAAEPGPALQERCPGCGSSFEHFAQTQRLGCEQCYEAFASRLEPLLAQFQPGATHVGKIPARRGGSLRLERDAAELRKALDEAIHDERYERAAMLRDRLRALDTQRGEQT